MNTAVKSSSHWLIQFDLDVNEIDLGRWKTHQWSIVNLHFPLAACECVQSQLSLLLELFKDERTDYRFNLSSHDPQLFFVFEQMSDQYLHPVKITASQAAAANFMDAEYAVHSVAMPFPIQAWIEAFIGRHGESFPIHKKKRKSTGRTCGN